MYSRGMQQNYRAETLNMVEGIFQTWCWIRIRSRGDTEAGCGTPGTLRRSRSG